MPTLVAISPLNESALTLIGALASCLPKPRPPCVVLFCAGCAGWLAVGWPAVDWIVVWVCAWAWAWASETDASKTAIASFMVSSTSWVSDSAGRSYARCRRGTPSACRDTARTCRRASCPSGPAPDHAPRARDAVLQIDIGGHRVHLVAVVGIARDGTLQHQPVRIGIEQAARRGDVEPGALLLFREIGVDTDEPRAARVLRLLDRRLRPHDIGS